MSEMIPSPPDSHSEKSITVIGEIDDTGLDALAELLIAAAQRRQQDEEGAMTCDQAHENGAG